MLTRTVNRFIIQNPKGQYYNGSYDWSKDIWDAKLYPERPFIGHSRNTIKLVSISYKEYPYDVEEDNS